MGTASCNAGRLHLLIALMTLTIRACQKVALVVPIGILVRLLTDIKSHQEAFK
jgi:hypothetical protein